MIWHDDGQARFYLGDVRECLGELADGSAHCVVTSPPYWGLRDYGVAGQLGLESTPRTVWTIATEPYPEAHFATFPTDLVEPCVLAGCPEGGTVLDPFVGSGTTAYVAKKLGRRAIGIDLNENYLQLARRRCAQMGLIA